jgi:mycothiol synthase
MARHGLTHRAYRGDPDLQRLLAALSRAHADPSGTSLLHPGDLVWAIYQNTLFDPQRSIELWESSDSGLVGFGFFEDGDFDTQCFVQDPDERFAFEADALALAGERARQAGAAELRTAILASAALRHDLLAAKDFVPDDTRVTRRGEPHTAFLNLRRSLDDLAVQAAMPNEFIVRPVGREEEWQARVDLHRVVWAPSRVTLEAYRRLRAAPVYRSDLDLVAVAPDGSLAAYAIVWYDAACRVGEFEPVGTHPAYRRRGAARAVMLAGLRCLHELGAYRALVTSSATNPASIGLYESVGFRIADRERFYRAPTETCSAAG